MLPAGGSCLLGSINLAEFATSHGFNFDDFRKMQWEEERKEKAGEI